MSGLMSTNTKIECSQMGLACSVFLAAMLLTACSPQDSQQAYGILERDRVTLTASANEVITQLPVKEGQVVKPGDVLVQLDNKNQTLLVAKAQAEQDKAQAELTKLLNGERSEDIAAAKANLANAKAQVTEAEKNYRRVAELLARKLAAQSDKDSALALRDTARAAYTAAEQNWKKLTAGSRQEDIASAQAELNVAQQQFAWQQHQLKQLTVLASREGIVDSLPYNLGERVPVNAVVAILQTNSVPYARVYIPEPFRAQLSRGSKVTVHIDGVEQSMSGTVRWLSVEPAFTPYNNMSERDRSRLVYLTEIDLPAQAQSLPAGILVQVDLE